MKENIVEGTDGFHFLEIRHNFFPPAGHGRPTR
jgi:hypothetical protein